MKLGNFEIRARKSTTLGDEPGAELYGSLVSALGALGTGMIVWDSGAGKVEWANKTAADLLGVTIDHVRSRTELDHLLPLEERSAPGVTVVTHGSEGVYDRPVLCGDGVVRIFEISTKQWHGSKTIIAFRDVTERRQLEEFRDRFVASAAHELRTPLTPLIGLIKMLRRDDIVLDEAQHEEALASIERQAERILALVTNLLDLSRLEHGRFELELAVVPLRPLVDQAIDALPPMSGRELTVRVAPDVRVIANAFALGQVLINLLVNAYRYGGDQILVSAEPTGDGEVRIEVLDNGPGVKPELVPRLFEAFARGREDHSGGAGLGLTIARMFAEACGGTLGYEAAVEGACFIVTLAEAPPLD